MDKFLAMGMPLTNSSALEPGTRRGRFNIRSWVILSIGSPGDVAVLRLEKGHFGFVDQIGARLDGTEKLLCELTVRDGKVVYDLNGMTRERWTNCTGLTRIRRPPLDGLAPTEDRVARGPATKR